MPVLEPGPFVRITAAAEQQLNVRRQLLSRMEAAPSGEFTAGCLCSNSARSDVIKGSNQVKVDSFGSGEYLGQNQPCGFKSNSSEL
ncbi:hypothetical protein V6N11_044841 [Hibiscus sabdariffa]|uniref:Uncharacterized protein n=1 Tax=Hibiscus sabdariffa TaxID=183260 RepID=A0ABR2PU50_9ROSI